MVDISYMEFGDSCPPKGGTKKAKSVIFEAKFGDYADFVPQ